MVRPRLCTPPRDRTPLPADELARGPVCARKLAPEALGRAAEAREGAQSRVRAGQGAYGENWAGQADPGAAGAGARWSRGRTHEQTTPGARRDRNAHARSPRRCRSPPRPKSSSPRSSRCSVAPDPVEVSPRFASSSWTTRPAPSSGSSSLQMTTYVYEEPDDDSWLQ